MATDAKPTNKSQRVVQDTALDREPSASASTHSAYTRTRTLRSSVSEWNHHWPTDSLAFAPYEPLASSLAAHADWPLCEQLNAWTDAQVSLDPLDPLVPRARRVRFAAAERESSNGSSGIKDTLYDQLIVQRHTVRTRERHWHDVMNALVWAAFPQAKWELHARQSKLVEQMLHSGHRNRSPMHDTLAMLDEGGVVVLAEPSLCDAIHARLCAKDRSALEHALVTHRASLIVFGHGILESIALRAQLCDVYAYVCVLPATLEHDAAKNPLKDRTFADTQLACALREERAPTYTKPRPSLLLDEDWLHKLQSDSRY